jgi:cyclic pyranopterin phosphate synthase
MSKLTHFDDEGRAQMVDVGGKPETAREAEASGAVHMEAATLERIRAGTLEKGDVLGVARLAAVQGVKKTSELVPLCHPLRVTGVEVLLTPADGPPRVDIRVTVRAFDRTGVEMEALTACAIAALTIYDMCKSIDRSMTIGELALWEKTGGRSGTYRRPGADLDDLDL